MKQTSLFGNLPQMSQSTKELNKNIVQRASAPKKSKTTTVRARNNTNTIAKKVMTLVEALRSRLVDDNSLECIRDEQTFREYMKSIRENNLATLDTETTGLDPIENNVVGICLYTKGRKPAYVPINHTDFNDNLVDNQVSEEVVREEFEKSLNVNWIYHNAKFDMRFMKNSFSLSNYPHCYWDTSLASNFLNENEPHGLKYLWNKYVNRNAENNAESFDKLFEKTPFNYIPIDVGYIYAAKDAKVTMELYNFQIQFLNDSETAKEKDLFDAYELLSQIEIPLIPILCEMEDTGIRIDKEFAESLSVKYTKMIEEVQEKFNNIAKKWDFSTLASEKREKLSNPINLNSPAQLSIIIYDFLEMRSVDRKSPRGTGEEIIEKLAEYNSAHQDLFDVILEYRGLAKLLSTYINKMPAIVKEKTNKLHGQFNQYGAKTGRFSSSDPNLQNIPSKNKEIRKMFTASEGYVLIGGDFSQQEPRVLAHLCSVLFNDNQMVEAYLSGKDLYAWMASAIYQTEYENCKEFRPDGTKNPDGKKRRDSVKSILLGLMYGRTTKSIGVQLGVDEAEAQKIVDMLFDTFPGIRDVVEYFKRQVKATGFIKTLWGRKRRLPEYNLPKYDFVDINDRKKVIEDDDIRKYYWHRMENAYGSKARMQIKKEANEQGIWIVENDFIIQETERQILNSVIQGSSADITKKAMLLVGQDERLKKLNYRLLLTVHDELIGECPKENALQCKDIMRELMLKATEGKIIVPMSVDCELTERWYGEDIEANLTA